MQAKKSLGQHFLTSEAAVHHMVTASNLKKGDVVLEIGPGKGVLTKALLETGASVYVVEKDDRMIPLLTETFASEIQHGQLQIVHGDILTTNIASLIGNRDYVVTANIPYYITGEIMRFFLESDIPPKNMTLLVQKEVAERIVARDKKESILSLSVKAFGTPTLISVVKRGSFFPIPNVDSAIIHIEVRDQKLEIREREKFFKIIKAGLGHKRKKLISNLAELYTKDTLSRAFVKLSLSEDVRGEDLDISTWINLTQTLSTE